MYGGKEANDEAAMKAASNELAGLVHVFKCAVSAVHLPLAALIDLKGYRLAAFALLPIDKTTIVYGSADGGKNVVNKSVFASNKMKQLASALNLMEHSGNIMHDFFFFFFFHICKSSRHADLPGCRCRSAQRSRRKIVSVGFRAFVST